MSTLIRPSPWSSAGPSSSSGPSARACPPAAGRPRRGAWLALAAAPLLGVLGGCGLISSDVGDFDLTLPDKAFSVDASSWSIDAAAVPALLSTSCASAPMVCASAAAQACKNGACAGSCNATTSTCDLTIDVSLYRPVDLLAEKPELKTLNDQPLISVTIDRFQYEVRGNTLDVAAPAMTVYVAPMSVMSPRDPMAKAVGTIAPIGAGKTVPTTDLAFTPTGKADLVAAMNNFKTPFNVLVGTSVTLRQGDMIPTGKLDALVRITAHTGL